MTTFNAYGSSAKEYGRTNKPVWLGTVSPHTVGGVLAEKYRVRGAHYPAGCPVNLTDGVLTPVIVLGIKSTGSGSVTIDPSVFNIAPAVGDKMKLVGSDSAVAITSVATNASDANLLDIKVALESPEAGKGVILIPTGADESVKANGYLYNDIYLGDLSDANATGAVVDFHGEGLLVDFTPAAFMADEMKELVPTVIQSRFAEGAFKTE